MAMIPPPKLTLCALKDQFELRDFTKNASNTIRDEAREEVRKSQPEGDTKKIQDIRHYKIVESVYTQPELREQNRYWHELSTGNPAALFSFSIYQNKLHLNLLYVIENYRGQRLAFYDCETIICHLVGSKGVNYVHIDTRTDKMANTARHLKERFPNLNWHIVV